MLYNNYSEFQWGAGDGVVLVSSPAKNRSACSRVAPHISVRGAKLAQMAGRLESPNSRHASCSFNCTQRTPAGLPSGMPGIGEEIDGAMQHAPQRGRQFMPQCVMTG